MTDPADALRDLAQESGSGNTADANASSRPESPIAPTPPPGSQRPEAPVPVYGDDEASASASALAQLSGTGTAVYDPAMSTASRLRIPKPDVGLMQVKSAAVPVLVTVGLIMTALGVWGLLVRAGNTTLPLADRPDAGQYAIIALVGLPLAACLFAGAGFFFYQVLQDKRKLADYEAAKKTQRRG